MRNPEFGWLMVILLLAGCPKEDMSGGTSGGVAEPAKPLSPSGSLSGGVSEKVEPKKGPRPAKLGLDPSGKMRFSAEDRCPVCAMTIADRAKTAAGVVLKGGKTFYTCGTGCAIRCWLHPDAYLGAPKEQLDKMVVRDYFSGKPVSGADVTWIAGSDVTGPMGPALVPIATSTQVEVFQKRHGGKHTFRLSEMNDAKWEAVTGKKAAPQKK